MCSLSQRAQLGVVWSRRRSFNISSFCTVVGLGVFSPMVVFGGNEGWLGSVEMGLSSPLYPTLGRLERWAGLLLHLLVGGTPGEMLMLLLLRSVAEWAPVRGYGEGQGCLGPSLASAYH